MIIAALILVVALCVVGSDHWPQRRSREVFVLTVAVGLAYTIYSERLNTTVRQSWTYRCLALDRSRANALIHWGNNDCVLTHPLHFVSDMLFNGVLQKGKELALVDVLLEAGAFVDFRKNGKRETPLIGAASLGAEDVGLRLLEAGAEPELRGEWGESALHWAALLGEERLAGRLITRTDLSLRDEKYNSSPLGWAVHGCFNPPAGNQGRQREVAALLVAAGAKVEVQWLESEEVRADPSMLTVLRSKMA